MTKLYHYDDKGFYTHKTEARLDPIGGEPLVLAGATLTAPLPAVDGQISRISRWNETQQQWEQVVDYRGLSYWTPAGGLIEITEAGASPPAGAAELKAGQTLIQESETWRLRTDADDLAEAKKNKIAEIKAAVEKAIKSGFESAALGAGHKYDSEQHNVDWIQAAVASGNKTKITCDDLKGTATSKKPREHTPAQCKTVLTDGMAKLLTRKTRFRTLRDQVNAAADVQAVESIKWQ